MKLTKDSLQAIVQRGKYIDKLQSEIKKLRAHNKVLKEALVKFDEDYKKLIQENTNG